MDSSQDYAQIISELMEYVPDIIAVAVVEGNELAYSTDNWDISAEINTINSGWTSLKAPFFVISGVKYTTLRLEIDSLVATSVKGEGHIIGFKDENIKIISYVTPEGDQKAAIVELQRVVQGLISKEPYISENEKISPKYGHLVTKKGEVDPALRNEITTFLNWMNDDAGLPGFIQYYLDQNDENVISDLAKIYSKLREIFNV